MATRECIFCGRKPVTEEDVFPKWMTRVLRREPWGVPNSVRMISQLQTNPNDDIVERAFQSRLLKVIAKCVCESCNTGWMSNIEDMAKYFLEPMIGGEDCELNADAQVVIATWAALKAIVGHYSYQHMAPLAEDWRTYFYRQQRPPSGWWVLVAGYEGIFPAWLNNQAVSTTSPRPISATITSAEQGVVMSLIVGRLAIKVFGIRAGKPRVPGADSLLRIWPTSPLVLRWPPVSLVNDDTVEDFISMGVS